MKVEIWSSVVCPWCYIGKRNLAASLAVFEHGDEVVMVWRSFELDPGAPAVRDVTTPAGSLPTTEARSPAVEPKHPASAGAKSRLLIPCRYICGSTWPILGDFRAHGGKIGPSLEGGGLSRTISSSAFALVTLTVTTKSGRTAVVVSSPSR